MPAKLSGISRTRTRSAAPGLARHRVRDQLQRMILSGELRSGTRLPQQRLARRFGVAQGAVRESLLELEQYGLVEMTDGLGATVRHIDAQTLLHASNIREVLEGMAARLCCQYASRADLDELEHLARAVDEAGLAGRIEKGARLDQLFHERVVELSRNPLLRQLSNSYRAYVKMVRIHREGEVMPAEHVRLVALLKEGDAERAERMMRKHIRDGTILLGDRLQSGEIKGIPASVQGG